MALQGTEAQLTLSKRIGNSTANTQLQAETHRNQMMEDMLLIGRSI